MIIPSNLSNRAVPPKFIMNGKELQYKMNRDMSFEHSKKKNAEIRAKEGPKSKFETAKFAKNHDVAAIGANGSEQKKRYSVV